MFYGILRSQENEVISFMVDEDDIPFVYETEEEAMADFKDHPYAICIDIIEID